MKRSLVLVLGLVLVVVGVLVLRHRLELARVAPRPDHNPAGLVASDVALLAATGRPQLVEIFHYG